MSATQRLVVRNEYLPEREILTGIGQLTVKQLRGDDADKAEVFELGLRWLSVLPEKGIWVARSTDHG
jgi:hypothetical protein